MSDKYDLGSPGAKGADYSQQAAPPYPGDVDGGRPAAAGTPGEDSGKSCGTGAGKGVTGKQGLDGNSGTPGGNAGKAASVTIKVNQLEGSWTINCNGGDGGGGQIGGPGGTGQQGGAGGPASSHCGTGPGGDGGPGGTGGPGGAGGEPGDAAPIYITYSPTGTKPNITSTATGGTGGVANNGGPGGAGGTGGTGNPNGTDLSKSQGKGGKHGDKPKVQSGKSAPIYVNGKVDQSTSG